MAQPKVYYEYLKYNDADLFTVVCLPQEEGVFPTVIYRNPYADAAVQQTEEEVCRSEAEGFAPWLEQGYAVVYQHCRGRGKSSGHCIPYIHEREDGLFLQDWIRTRPFYNGELYLCGASYTSSVHFVTSPFAPDIKGAVLEVQDCERYNCNYRNGFYKSGLHGAWYVSMYKRNSIPKRQKHFTPNTYHMLPLSDFTKTVFNEEAEDFNEILKHPKREDPFWTTRFGGGEAHDAIKHADIPILLVTGFYDIYTGGVFDMWNTLDEKTKAKCALAVHPFDHGGSGKHEPVRFENGVLKEYAPQYAVRWINAVRGLEKPPFAAGKVTYYALFENQWRCDDFKEVQQFLTLPLGSGEETYRYNPYDPASFKGGLSANFEGNEWQDPPNSRHDIISIYTPEFKKDTFIKGKMRATLKVRSTCEDTCFYMRISLAKPEGDYGLRDDINQISNFNADYRPGEEIEMEFSFDEHAFLIQKGEKLRIDISSSADPHYVRHTNNKGLFSAQTTIKIADNTVILDQSSLTLPIDQK
ncbi:MAG: CocE/NonD family hydrolase [Clostridia bacterium]|nr:CocE/NonD family hydrolase [Clostridia bacterium]